MNSKGHFLVSMVKSLIRMVACCVALALDSLVPLAVGFLFAEILGMVEEVVDRR